MTPQLDKIRDRQVIGPTYIWHTAYVKKVTHDEIWKTTKFNLLNKIFQLQLKKKKFSCWQILKGNKYSNWS